MSEIKLINKKLGEIKINDNNYFAVPNDIYNALEELQQEIKTLKEQLYSPDQVETICPKCGEKYSTNYSRVVYDLRQENKELKETLKGTTHCYDEEEHQRLIKENQKLKETIENNSKINVADHKYASEMENKYLTEHNVLTEIEKWLEKTKNIYEIDNKYEEFDLIIETYQDCLDKLQELKEGKK